jgi:hypothetical protein
MTLIEQFPDVSMIKREKQKQRFKYNPALPFKDIHYTAISADQTFYDKEFRTFHYKSFAFISVLLAAVFFIILNGQGIWQLIIS